MDVSSEVNMARRLTIVSVATFIVITSWSTTECAGSCSGVCSLLGCSAPKPYPQRYIQPMEMTKSDYRIGDLVWYECQPSCQHKWGVGYSRCMNDGSWSTPDMKCVPLCGSPPDVAHTTHDAGTNEDNIGSEVTYWCKEGYSGGINNEMKMKCNMYIRGEWDLISEEIVCKKTCTAFDAANGDVQPNVHVPFNATVKITCNPGFYLEGPERLTCWHNGHWTEGYPTCKAIKCPWPKDPNNGYILNKDTSVGTVLTYRCNRGYLLFGASQRECSKEGHWTGAAGYCEEIDCGIPNVPLGICNISRGTHYKDQVQCRCDAGASHNFTLICNYRGRWQTNCYNKCHSDCHVSIGTGIQQMKHDSEQTCKCENNKKVRCYNGTWFPKDFKRCFPVCETPVIANGTISKNTDETAKLMFTIGTSVLPSCDDGFYLNGTQRSSCICPGVWSPALPNCVIFSDVRASAKPVADAYMDNQVQVNVKGTEDGTSDRWNLSAKWPDFLSCGIIVGVLSIPLCRTCDVKLLTLPKCIKRDLW